MYQLNRKAIPTNPGVYLYKNSKNEIIYVGKAKNLRNRVSSYFNNKHETSPKTQFLVKQIHDMEFFIVDNEVEALLLENRLIKKHKPKYNINLKDGKTYAYIKITNEEIPKITTTRRVTDKASYFGPFIDGYQRILLFNLAVKIFKLVTNKTYSSKSKLNYEIGLAPAPTEKEIDLKEYLKNVEEAKKFLAGKNHTKIVNKLEKEMIQDSKNLNYEKALEKKKQIEAIQYLKERQKVDLVKDYDQNVIVLLENTINKKLLIQLFKISKGVISGKKEFRFENEEDILEQFIKMYYSQNEIPKEILINKEFWDNEEDKQTIEGYLQRLRGTKVMITVPKIGEKKKLVNLAEKNALLNFDSNDVLEEIKTKLDLPKLPKVIECFDMSNLGYDYLVGGMTRWVNGRPDKENYRKFEIKSFKGKNDDYKSMLEVVYRRYRRLKEENLDMPDLIIIDGGKGQLSAATEALKRLRLNIPIISLAKKEEEIFKPGVEESFKFDNNSKMMLLIRQIRDSVHTFVINYNRKKREMRLKEEMEK